MILKVLVLLHRWLGVGCCLLFAMWFATGIVMHFVPFPSLTEAARFAGLMPIDLSRVTIGPDEAVAASHIVDARRLRLVQGIDGPVYIVSGPSRLVAVRATDRSDASVTSAQMALQIAQAHARERLLDATRAAFADLADDDQWSVPNGYDVHRPLYRVALNDNDGTDLYVSSITGEVVLGTTRHERAFNYVGSVVHWIYPTLLRRHWSAWDRVVWTLSLIAVFAAVSGIVLGVTRLRVSDAGVGSPFRGWHAWHHVLGLFTATFVLTWIVSGWLSMDHGRLFSRGHLSDAEAEILTRAPDWHALSGKQGAISAAAREVEWFALGERFYRRDRIGLTSQAIFAVATGSPDARLAEPHLTVDEVAPFVRRIAPGCAPPAIVGPRDSYPVRSLMPGAPVYRAICGDVWYQIDGGNGGVMERLDASRRAYRWMYTGLHTLDFPLLSAHPMARSVLIVVLCALGFVFSLTGVVIGWRRLRFHFPPHGVSVKPQAYP